MDKSQSSGDEQSEEKKKRSFNWSDKDSCVLVEYYAEIHQTICGSFHGIGAGAITGARQMKAKAWTELLKRFTVQNPDKHRTLDEIKNRITNIKDKVRLYAKAVKFNLTGGGPKPEVPPAYVEKMYHIVYGSSGDSVDGIKSRVESGAHSAESIMEDETAAAAKRIDDILTTSDDAQGEQANETFPHERNASSETSPNEFPPAVPQQEKPRSGVKRFRYSSAGSSMGFHFQQEFLLQRQQAKLVEKQLLLVQEHRNLIAKQDYKTDLGILLVSQQLKERGIQPPQPNYATEVETPSRLLNQSLGDDSVFGDSRALNLLNSNIPTGSRVLEPINY